MKFKIPFTFLSIPRLKAKSRFLVSKIKHKHKSKLENTLEIIGVDLTREEYIAILLYSFILSFLFLFVLSSTILILAKASFFYLLAFGFSFVFSGFIMFVQFSYPNIYISKKQKKIEKNLIPALQDMLIQLNSGVPLFSILVNLSNARYGLLSLEFKKAVKRINTGEPESSVLDDLGRKNPSVFFRRTLWQISSGMKAGSDISIIIKDNLRTLSEEQMVQIQNYGNKLNPLIVFYMLISVIIPALSVTFLTIISSIVNIEKNMAMLMFIGLFVFVVFMQIMFLGLIKSRRPSLL